MAQIRLDRGRSGVLDDAQKLAGALGHSVRIAFADRLYVDEIGAHTKSRGSCFYEISSGCERNAARRDHFYLRQRAFEILKVTRAADGSGGKDLDHRCT